MRSLPAIQSGTPPTGIVAATRQTAIRPIVLLAGCAEAATADVAVVGTSPARAAADRISAHRVLLMNPRLLGYLAVARHVTRVGRAQMGPHGAADGITGILHREGPAIRRANGPVHVFPG